LFFAHLVLEKLLKAHHVKDNAGDFSPRTHNLLLLSEQTGLSPSDEQLRIFSQMNQFQIEGRYPDYKLTMFKLATQSFTQDLLQEVEIVKSWLTSTLQ
jgi:HEPN domain-containing protein